MWLLLKDVFYHKVLHVFSSIPSTPVTCQNSPSVFLMKRVSKIMVPVVFGPGGRHCVCRIRVNFAIERIAICIIAVESYSMRFIPQVKYWFD